MERGFKQTKTRITVFGRFGLSRFQPNLAHRRSWAPQHLRRRSTRDPIEKV